MPFRPRPTVLLVALVTILPRRFRVVAWTVVLLCLATTCVIIVSRIRSYNREGSLVRIQAEARWMDTRRRRYQAAADSFWNGARRAGMETQAVVTAVMSGLQRRRDEAFLRSLQAQVDYKIASFETGDLEPLASYSSHVEATNAVWRLLSVHIQSALRHSEKGASEGGPQRYFLLVRKTDAVTAREALASEPNLTVN